MEPNDRWFEWNYAVAMRSGALHDAISAYKYRDRKGWAIVFGRILVGFLDAHAETFSSVDLIVGSPAYEGPDAARAWNPVREVMRAAEHEQSAPQRWVFDLQEPPAVTKTAPTPPMVGLKAAERRAVAQTDLRRALRVPDPDRTRGRALVVFDDVFTGGWTLREVARVLRQAGGATVVYGVSLARQPFNRRPT